MSDPIISAARFLADHLEWLRHRPEADEVLADIEACARIVAGIARGPAAQWYLGPCGARIPTESDQNGPVVSEECPGDIYARDGALSGTCRECKATIPVAERRTWLNAEVRSYAFPALDIARAYRINVKTIRSWANRGLLRSYWITDTGIVADWVDPPDGETRERRHYVGDVLDLAAADAARKASDQARRARRRDAA